VVTVELLVLLGLFGMAVVGGAYGGAGTLVGPVGEDEDLSGQAGLDNVPWARAAVRPWGCVPVSRVRITVVCRLGPR
jgi:hypothetical protein